MFFEEFAREVTELLGIEGRYHARMFEDVALTFAESLELLRAVPQSERAWFAECPAPEQVRVWARRVTQLVGSLSDMAEADGEQPDE